ncbi:MAG: penicillin-binding protein activator LpoB [Alphaproteobacteria bacterium]|nr:penicillin-binding protein activator LpoB [Alphaproteobacteria bacterium]
MEKLRVFLLLLAASLALVACGGGTAYNTAGDEDISTNFGIRDFRIITEQMADKMSGDRWLREEIGDERPAMLITPLVNRTDEHIDTASITQSLQVRFSRARLFTFVTRETLANLKDETALEQAGVADPATVARLGKVVGARYVLRGSITSFRNKVGKKVQTFYKVTIILTDIETGVDVWLDEVEVSKTTKKGLF